MSEFEGSGFSEKRGFSDPAISSSPSQQVPKSVTDYSSYVNMVQGPDAPNYADRQVIMRYPLGRIGLWSRSKGEIADSVTRGVRLYPLIDQIVNKDDSDWRGTVSGNPAQIDITYRPDVPARGSSVSLTVTPNVSVYRYHFASASSFKAVAVKLEEANYHGSVDWNSNTLTVIDNQTIQASISNAIYTIYYYIKTNVSSTGRGTFKGGIIYDGASKNTGDNNGGYLKFGTTTPDVTVAVALSHTSFAQAEQYFTNEFADFNFEAASLRLKDAWNDKLGKIEVQSADNLTTKMLYTGLYTVYVNIVNATDGSPYASYAAAYGSPVLTIGSSINWAYIGGGYFRCAFDQGRSVYSLLSLIDPSIMPDILHTYQAQYDHDHFLMGNWDPYTPSAWNDQQWGFWGGMYLRAKLMGITGVDYNKAKSAIADTFGNSNNYMATSKYLAKGYIPADTGQKNFMSRALDFATDIHGLALLAKVLGDDTTYTQWISRAINYANNWDATNRVFRAKNADGSWAARNTGFFEGDENTYAFDEPQDPLGLADLYGDDLMTFKINSLLQPNKDYNDQEPIYQILPIYSNSPATAQNITRARYIPQYNSLNMWEGWSSGFDVFYTHNAADLVSAILGLWPIQAPGAQFVINSPALTSAVIHGAHDITVQANNNSSSNIYISFINVNGSSYPSYFISGERLASGNTTITLNMTSNPSNLGTMYITGTDGEVLSAASDNVTYLQFQNDPVAVTSRAKIHTAIKPVDVSIDGKPLSWTYDASANTVKIKDIPAGTVLIHFR